MLFGDPVVEDDLNAGLGEFPGSIGSTIPGQGIEGVEALANTVVPELDGDALPTRVPADSLKW